ncbi:MAG TPA: outer membrane beta-barrel protein [Methylocystis sp.]|nr:outer membrane beta-barrel protein [Methylocystis sp.]
MRFLRTASLVALALVSGSALAADSGEETKKKPAPLWTGFYLGLNAGGGWSQTNGFNYYTFPDSFDPSVGGANNPIWLAIAATGTMGRFGGGVGGFLGGGQVGYNYQYTKDVVLGLEADLQGLTGNSVSATGFGFSPPVPNRLPTIITALTASRSLDYFGTIRGRVGYLLTPTLLGYVTGGVAYGQIGMASYLTSIAVETPSATIGGDSSSGVRAGWTAGAGVEWSLNPNWSVKAEYLYYDLGAPTAEYGLHTYDLFPGFGGPGADVLTTRASTRFDGHIFRLGANYHFNYGSAAIATTKEDAPEPGEKDNPSDYGKFYLTKIEAYGGTLHEGYPDMYWAGQGGASATVVYPFSKHYAFQLDATLDAETSSLVPGLAGHLYWADTKAGLLGAYTEGGWRSSPGGGQGDFKLGAEGAWFQDKFTLEGLLGIETQSLNANLPGYSCTSVALIGCYIGYNPPGLNFGLFDGFDNLQPQAGYSMFDTIRFFDHVEFDYYVHDNFKVSIAHEYVGGLNSGVLGAEYLIDAGSGIAPVVFFEASAGERGVASILGGVRFYFGEEGPKSLKRRLREDDPTVHLRRGINSAFVNQRSQPSFGKNTPYGHEIYPNPVFCSTGFSAGC